MAENRSVLYRSRQLSAAVLLAAAVIILIFRANRPAPPTEIPETSAASKYTFGTIIDAPVVVPPNGFVSYKVDFNRRVNLKGEFQTGNIKVRVECLVLDAQNFEAWKLNTENRRISATGYVPGGKIIRVLEPGTYYIVIANRGSDAGVEKTVRTRFAAE